MATIILTLYGRGGELDSRTVEVADPENVTAAVFEWLESHAIVLAAGDTITIADGAP
jgi:hypothetical protein